VLAEEFYNVEAESHFSCWRNFPHDDHILQANNKYAAGFGEKGKLALPPARRSAFVVCMDARLDPAKFAGLSEGYVAFGSPLHR
jgi:carbonic anhydrase